MNSKNHDFEHLERLFGTRGDCPPVDLLQDYLEETPISTDDQMDRHLSQCPHCRAEFSLLRSFVEAEPSVEEVQDLEWVTSKMRTPILPKSHVRSEPIRGFSRVWAFLANLTSVPVYASAAAILVLTVSLTFLVRTPPGIAISPLPDQGIVVRGSGLDLISPTGEILEIPEEFRWQAVEGARFYRVRFLEVDRHPLLEVKAETDSVAVPIVVSSALEAGRVLYWQVQAENDSGQLLAESDPARVRKVITR